MLIGKATAEKSVTIHHTYIQKTVNLVSRPILHMAG